MKYVLLIIFILTCSITSAQEEFCRPRKIEKVVDKIIKKLSKEDYDSIIGASKDSAVDNQLYFNYEINERKLKPIYKYLSSKGCNDFLVDNLEEIILEYTYYRMLKIDTCMSDLLQPYLDNHFVEVEQYARNVIADSIAGVYIPRNLEECFKQIDSFWTDSLKNEVKNMSENDFVGEYHFALGQWTRNNWGLWSGSRLRSYFCDMEVFHPDDMSGIILKSYHRYLGQKEIKLEEQVEFYHDFWNKVKKDEKKNSRWWKFRRY